MYVQNPINAQFISKIMKDNFFPQNHLLGYLYRKSSRWESQQSLNKCFIHCPDLLQRVRVPKVIWRHRVLNFKESMENQTHKIISRKTNPMAELFISPLTDKLPPRLLP